MSSKASSEDLARYRWTVTSRVLLAALGGYVLSSLAIVVLALLLPVLFSTPRAEALLSATLWSFVVYAVAAMYVFTARSVRRAAMVFSVAGLLLAAIYAGLRLLAV